MQDIRTKFVDLTIFCFGNQKKRDFWKKTLFPQKDLVTLQFCISTPMLARLNSAHYYY